MKTSLLRLARASVFAAVAFVSGHGALAAGTQTAQGIMVNQSAVGTFAIVNTQVYQYNGATAATYFTNAVTSGPSVSCNGSPTNCGSGNQPATPPAPPPDPTRVFDSGQPNNPISTVVQDQCTFFAGGTLAGQTYTRSVQLSGLNGRGSFTFTWTYTVSPNTNPVAALTAWDLFHQTNPDGTTTVSVAGVIAGESVIKSSNPKIGTKYSFSLLNNPPDQTSTRVTNLLWSVYDASNTLVYSSAPNSTVAYPVQFTYATNAGSNGVTSLLQNGDDLFILNHDGFAGNDNGGADGTAASLATVDNLIVNLGVGAYSVVLTGTVKDNAIDGTGANISFSVSQQVNIVGQGCGIM
jgi:hypothetical protein